MEISWLSKTLMSYQSHLSHDFFPQKNQEKRIELKGPELFQSTKTWIPPDNKTRNAQRNDDFIFMILLHTVWAPTL